MSTPFSLDGIRARLDLDQVGSVQADQLARAIERHLRAVCERRFPGFDYECWLQMLPEALLDVLISLLTWGEDGRIVADHLPLGAVGCIFDDLYVFVAPVD